MFVILPRRERSMGLAMHGVRTGKVLSYIRAQSSTSNVPLIPCNHSRSTGVEFYRSLNHGSRRSPPMNAFFDHVDTPIGNIDIVTNEDGALIEIWIRDVRHPFALEQKLEREG